MTKEKLITNDKIKAGDVIVGLAGFGRSNYENEYNSGIGSNGLTSARHDILQKTYGARFHESYDTSLDEHVVYIGPHLITDKIEIDDGQTDNWRIIAFSNQDVCAGVKRDLEHHFEAIHGLIH